MKKNQNGITLIALVVTIIVLLILAGVSIAMLTGEGNIFNNATNASIQTKLTNAADMLGMEISETVSDYYYSKYVADGKDTDTVFKKVKDTIDAFGNDETKKGGKEVSITGEASTKHSEGYKKVTITYEGYSTSADLEDAEGNALSSTVWSAPTKGTATN